MQCPKCYRTYGRSSRFGQRLEEIPGAGHPDDRYKALERLGREVRVGIVDKRPERRGGSRLAAPAKDLCRDHPRFSKWVAQRPDQLFGI